MGKGVQRRVAHVGVGVVRYERRGLGRVVGE